MGWWITVGILVLLAVLPLGVWVGYDSAGPQVRLVLGPVKFTVFPRQKKEKKKTKKESINDSSEKKKTEETDLPTAPQSPRIPSKKKKPAGGSLTDFIPFVKLAIDFLGDFRRKLRLKDLYLRLILASSDPCDLAVNYGKTWTAVGNLMPVLERWFIIKNRDVEVECDFTASETKILARLEISMTLGRLLSLVMVYAFRGLKELIQFRNKRKGGAVK